MSSVILKIVQTHRFSCYIKMHVFTHIRGRTVYITVPSLCLRCRVVSLTLNCTPLCQARGYSDKEVRLSVRPLDRYNMFRRFCKRIFS